MVDRFEKLTTGVTHIYKKIQKIKKHEMNALGLKGTQVMCIYYLSVHPEGLTASDLCAICNEDKAAISRILSELEGMNFISYDHCSDSKKYRAKIQLTGEGQRCASHISRVILYFTELSGQGITEEEREIFYRVLSVIAENIDRIYEE